MQSTAGQGGGNAPGCGRNRVSQLLAGVPAPPVVWKEPLLVLATACAPSAGKAGNNDRKPCPPKAVRQTADAQHCRGALARENAHFISNLGHPQQKWNARRLKTSFPNVCTDFTAKLPAEKTCTTAETVWKTILGWDEMESRHPAKPKTPKGVMQLAHDPDCCCCRMVIMRRRICRFTQGLHRQLGLIRA